MQTKVYALNSAYSDEKVENCYGDIQSIMTRMPDRYNVIMEDSSAKVVLNFVGEAAVGDCDADSRNE